MALKKLGLIARTEIWSWENQDYLLLRFYDSLTDEPRTPSDSWDEKPQYPIFRERRLPADVDRLVAEVFSNKLELTVFLEFSKKQILSLMEGENISQLIGLISNIWLFEQDLISDSEVRIPDTGFER